MQTAAASSSAKHNLLGQQGCGPLQLLLRAARSPHTRVRVVVRERHAIAGVIIARVVAFDKHVNMVLKQCTWYRYHDDNEDDDDGNEYNNCVPTAVSAGNPIGNRRRSHSRVGRGSTRTMPLMLLRGEHVVVVSLLHH